MLGACWVHVGYTLGAQVESMLCPGVIYILHVGPKTVAKVSIFR